MKPCSTVFSKTVLVSPENLRHLRSHDQGLERLSSSAPGMESSDSLGSFISESSPPIQSMLWTFHFIPVRVLFRSDHSMWSFLAQLRLFVTICRSWHGMMTHHHTWLIFICHFILNGDGHIATSYVRHTADAWLFPCKNLRSLSLMICKR
jgi:hypothetical protein